MSMQFHPKICLTVGVTSLLLASVAHLHLSARSNPSQLSLAAIQPTDLSTVTKTPINQTPTITTPITTEASNKQNNSVTAYYSVIDEWKKYQYSVNGQEVLKNSRLPKAKVNFNQDDLLTVLINTRKYYQEHGKEDPDISRNGILVTQGVNVQDIINTLDFMINILQEDIANKRPTRLQDPNFINANFRVIKWSAYNPQTPKQKKLRMTKYAAFIHSGSRTKTAKYNIPLYALKPEFSNDNFYTRYTKQDVLSGIYEPGGKEHGKVEPLAYLTREGLEAALLQGTVLVNFTDGTKAFFNVDKNNGISYVRGVKPTEQKRYWYFRQVEAIKGYGYKIDAKISIKPGVTFAGDVLNIGLGRVILIEYNQGRSKQLRMGVLADTGGAFLPNLYQLDYLAGIFNSEREFNQYIRQLPEYVNAYILVKKS